MSDPITVGIVGLLVVLVLFLTGIELGFAMVLMGFLGFAYLISVDAAMNLLAKDMYDVLNSYGFTVIPSESGVLASNLFCADHTAHFARLRDAFEGQALLVEEQRQSNPWPCAAISNPPPISSRTTRAAPFTLASPPTC